MKTTRVLALPLLVVLSGVLLTLVFLNVEHRYSLEHERLDTYKAVQGHVSQLESLIDANLIIGKSVRAEIRLHGDLNTEEMDRMLGQLLIADLQIRHIAIAPDLVISYVYPRLGNEAAIGLNYLNNDEQRPSVVQAMRDNQVIVAGPVNLVQGGRALIARLPVFLDDASTMPWGVIAVVMEFEKLLSAAGLDALEKDYRIAIRRVASQQLPGNSVYGDQSLFAEDAIFMNVALPSGTWEVAIMPRIGWHMPLTIWLSISVIGFILTLLCSWVVYLLLRHREDVKQHMLAFQQQANHDYLTGLPNRLQLSRYLKRITRSGKGEEEPFCLVFIDIDNFKEINDSLGHNLGDELLVKVAVRLQESLRPSDFLARLGGDEFVIVLNGMCDPAQTELWAKKLIDDLSPPFVVGHQDLIATVSIGIAFFPQDGLDEVTLLQHADRAMYAAKDSGKNTFCFFNLSLRLQADKHIQIYHEMIAALDAGEFDVFYQPIMDLRSGTFPRCEALIRWRHPEKGWISPMDFIPIAEKTGFIRTLGIWVLHKVCADMVKLREQGFTVNVAVNRSTNEFRDVATLRQWLPIIESYGLEPGDFTLEITESLLMTDDNHHLDKVQLVKSQGFKVAIDDFGTGYSGINYLRQYPVDIVKIDKSFIDNLLSSEQDRTFFDVLVQMAKILDLQLVIEGIEFKEQLTFVTEKKCEFGQGFFMAKPMPFNDLLTFMQQHSMVDSTSAVTS